MKKADVKTAFPTLFRNWLAQAKPDDRDSFISFEQWLATNHSSHASFTSRRATTTYDLEAWFDEQLRLSQQAERNNPSPP
jgi:hypothetical protein